MTNPRLAPQAVAARSAERILLWPTVQPDVLEVVKDLGRRRELRAGDRCQTVGGLAWAGLVVSGLLRGAIASVSGREASLVYARPGALLGEGVLWETAKSTVEAMVPTVVFELPARELRETAKTDPQLKLLILNDLERVVELLLAGVSEHAFGDLRTRLARHLLALAEVQPDSGSLDVRLTRQQLASAVASTTDPVTRVVRGMAREGLLSLGPRRIALLDPARLLTIATTL